MFSRNTLFIKNVLTKTLSVGRNEWNICWPKPDYGPMEVLRSELLNGTKVASAKPMGAQVGAATIMYQAGSRYEADDEIGVSHFLRALSGGAGCGYTAYIKSRYLQQSGAYITCTSDRQSVAYTLVGPVTCFQDLKSYLLDTAARLCYHPWEISDAKRLVKEDLVRISPGQAVMDLIQKASFSGALSQSVFCPASRIDSMSKKAIDSFIANNYKSVRCTVGSCGVSYEEVMKMAEKINLRREKPADPCTPPTYAKGGYECYDLGPGKETWIAVAVPGTGSCDVYCLLKHNILAAACGVGNMQKGMHSMDRTPQPPLGTVAGDDIFTDYRAFNISYFDVGIFGILARTRSETARQVATNAIEFLANIGDLSFKQIETGKQRLKTSLAIYDDDAVRVSEGLALQIASSLQMDSARNSLELIDLLPPEDILCAAKMLSSKREIMSMAVVGDVGVVPEGRELLSSF